MIAWKNFNVSNLIKDSLRAYTTRVKIFQIAKKEGSKRGRDKPPLGEKKNLRKVFLQDPQKLDIDFFT